MCSLLTCCFSGAACWTTLFFPCCNFPGKYYKLSKPGKGNITVLTIFLIMSTFKYFYFVILPHSLQPMLVELILTLNQLGISLICIPSCSKQKRQQSFFCMFQTVFMQYDFMEDTWIQELLTLSGFSQGTVVRKNVILTLNFFL